MDCYFVAEVHQADYNTPEDVSIPYWRSEEDWYHSGASQCAFPSRTDCGLNTYGIDCAQTLNPGSFLTASTDRSVIYFFNKNNRIIWTSLWM